MNFKVVPHTVIEGQRISGSVSDPCVAPDSSRSHTDNQWPPDRQADALAIAQAAVRLGVTASGQTRVTGMTRRRDSRASGCIEGASSGGRISVRALHRNGYAGMQRMARFWSGDVLPGRR
jgi:hypothetical protein